MPEMPLHMEARKIRNAAQTLDRHCASAERSAIFATAVETAVLSGRCDLPPDLLALLGWAMADPRAAAGERGA